jgi:hypothetical protein
MAGQQEPQAEQQASQQQIDVAHALQIAEAGSLPVVELIRQIESKLGQDTLAEHARWYLMSVLRHLNKDDWSSLEASGIAGPLQQELIDRYIATDDAKQALRSVLKEPHCRFTLLGFAKARRVEQHVLSTTTKAYRNAAALLRELDLVVSKQRSASSRRAARRQPSGLPRVDTPGFVAAPGQDSIPEPSAVRDSQSQEPVAGQNVEREAELAANQDAHSGREDSWNAVASLERAAAGDQQMGDDEFARFDALVTAAPPPAPNWQEAKEVDRQSLMLGLGAGALLFVLILLFY